MCIFHLYIWFSAKKDLILESQHPGGLEKIQYLEDSSRYKRTDVTDEMITVKPHFLTKPKPVEVKEGGHAHFECKLEPVTDTNLKVEWFKNGRPIIVGKDTHFCFSCIQFSMYTYECVYVFMNCCRRKIIQ